MIGIVLVSYKDQSAAKDERFENDQVNKDLENEVYKEETGDPKGGHTMASMVVD